MTHNKQKTCLGYNNDVSFHILDFAKPIKFWSDGFLDGVVPEKFDRCQQCNRVGHTKYRCFDLHPCEHCGKKNHESNICSKKKIISREKLSFGWIASCEWTKAAKKIYKSYRWICSRVTSLAVMTNISHLISDKGGFFGAWSATSSSLRYQVSLSQWSTSWAITSVYWVFSEWALPDLELFEELLWQFRSLWST